MITVRQAQIDDYDDVEYFYCDLIDSMKESAYKPDWVMGVYPTERLLKEAISNETLYLAYLGNDLAGAMIVNHACEPEYETVKWQVDAKKNEVAIIHLLGVAPAFQGQSVARQMAAYVIEKCRKNAIKAIRLDVLKKNIPAAKLYLSAGFTYIDSVKIYYEDTGLTDFLLYELAL